MSKIYKIRQRSTGLFAEGTGAIDFTEKGRTWKRLGDVKLHIHTLLPRNWSNSTSRDHTHVYDDCDVVAYELREVETVPVEDLINDVRDKKDKREREWREIREVEERKRKEQEFERLKKELGR